MIPEEAIAQRRGDGPIRTVVLGLALVVTLLLSGAGTLVIGGGLGDTAQAQDAPTTQTDGDDLSVADVAELANPAVVTITSLDDGFRGGDDPFAVGTGSGFIVDAEGHVVTNSHVVEGADDLSVLFFDGEEVTATVVGRDPFQDIAVLQLDLTDGQEVPGFLSFGDSTAVRAGDQVVSIGSALGEFTNTVTEGTVGAIDRALGSLPNLLQHDAPIWPGNSGGPILNLDGEVVGVNVAGMGDDRRGVDTAPAQIGFAIEADAVERIVDELIATGEVIWPYIGIFGEAINEGHEVVEVIEDSPAEAAGMEEDDIITAVDGQALDGENGLIDALALLHPGDTVDVTIDRDGEEQTLQVTLGERPADAA